MSTHGPVEGDDTTAGKQFAQVIESASVSQANFHQRTLFRQVEIGCEMVENIPLRGQPANKTVQSAHGPSVSGLDDVFCGNISPRKDISRVDDQRRPFAECGIINIVMVGGHENGVESADRLPVP